MSRKILKENRENIQDIVDQILEVVKDYKKFYQLGEGSRFRKGQIVFNACYEVWPEEVEGLRATDYDCFYYDDQRKVDIFIDVLAKHIYDSRLK